MLEQIIKFIELNESFKYFTILDSHGSEMLNYYSAEPESIISEISKDFQILDNGKYTIIGRTGKTSGLDASTTKKFSFIIKPEITRTKTANNMDAEYIEKRVREAYEQGNKDAQLIILNDKINALDKKVDLFIEKTFDEFKKKVAAKFDELDGEADNDLLGKATEMITPHLGTIMEKLPDFNLK